MRTLLLAVALATCALPLSAGAGADCREAAVSADEADRNLTEARCWLRQGRYAAALLAAERVLALRPGDAEGEAVREQALRHMQAVPLVEQADGPVAQGWIALQAGYDTNANLGTEAEEVRIPLRLRLPAIETEDLHQRSSRLLGLHGGFDAAFSLSQRNRLRLVGLAGARANLDAYLTRNYALEAHAEHRGDFLRPGFWLALEEQWYNKYGVLKARTLGGRLAAPLAGDHELELFHAVTPKKFPFFELSTIERTSGVALRQTAWRMRFALFGGTERAKGGPSFLDRDFVGVATQASAAAGPGRLYLGVQHVRSDFLVFSRPFLVHRHDEFSELHAAYDYALGRNWRLVPRVVLQENRSNIVVTAYERVQWLLELRRQF